VSSPFRPFFPLELYSFSYELTAFLPPPASLLPRLLVVGGVLIVVWKALFTPVLFRNEKFVLMAPLRRPTPSSGVSHLTRARLVNGSL